MDLQKLIVWTKETLEPKKLKEMVRKEADVVVCNNLLVETGRRAALAIDADRRAVKYAGDIQEYLATLRKRGIMVPNEFLAQAPAGGVADGRR
jgi:nicotinate-nucleotide pyrophosphorylase